ncbi:MAG TPA: DUF3570 domain-containing protein [Polyangiales bacterium]|nr:DUF3570 domain-containing protein [Polyangiales bacterium]
MSLASALACLLAPQLAAAQPRDELSTAMYVRIDTDDTTVISPYVRAAKKLAESTGASATYTADIWTSASVDIRSSASVQPVRPVTEQRDELDLALTQEVEDLSLKGAYRFSSEHDYTSHGVMLDGAFAFADKAATLSLALKGLFDTVGQAGDPSFQRSLSTMDAALSFTQVIDPHMFAQATYEIAHSSGYQASPYRWVGVGPGATGFGCVGAQPCVRERVPDARTRNALALMLRRALSDSISLGAGYRYYFDDWGLGSHTVLAELGWNLGSAALLLLRYRFYTQTQVDFYQAQYPQLAVDAYRTRDRELSPMSYHRIGADFHYDVDLRADKARLTFALSAGGNFYTYDDFVGLSSAQALELTGALTLSLL